MATLHNLKPEKVIKALERAGWINKGQRGSHVKQKGLDYEENGLNSRGIDLNPGKSSWKKKENKKRVNSSSKSNSERKNSNSKKSSSTLRRKEDTKRREVQKVPQRKRGW